MTAGQFTVSYLKDICWWNLKVIVLKNCTLTVSYTLGSSIVFLWASSWLIFKWISLQWKPIITYFFFSKPSVCRSCSPSQSFKMQWNVLRTVSWLAPRMCLESQTAGLFGHHQHVKGPLLLHHAKSRVVWAQSPQEQLLHSSVPHCRAEERKPLATQPPRPGVLCHEQQLWDVSSTRGLSSSTTQATPSDKKEEPDPLQDKSIGLYQRFKKTFRQYGKVLIPVHLITSGVWFGTFYYAAIK